MSCILGELIWCFMSFRCSTIPLKAPRLLSRGDTIWFSVLFVYLCTQICSYTWKWTLIKPHFSTAHIPFFLNDKFATTEHPFLTNFSPFLTMVVLPVLHLPTAKPLWKRKETEEKPKKVTCWKILLHLIFSYLSFFYWTLTINFDFLQTGRRCQLPAVSYRATSLTSCSASS